MISTQLARALHDSGLSWRPASGDAFRIDRPEVEGDVFTVSEMTIEAFDHPTGTILGFNGTTEWALDSVDLDDALWLPREDQLRNMLRGAFRLLERETDDDGTVLYRVEAVVRGLTVSFAGGDAADAYGRAVLAMIDTSANIELGN